MTASGWAILIADDNEMNRWILAEQLHHWSQDVVSVCDGLEAWEELQQRRFDIVFLDLSMPELDGLSLMKRLRATPLYANAPIIAVTAHLLPDQRSGVMAQGFDEVLLKPITLADLERCIARAGGLYVGDVAVYADPLLEKVSFNRSLGEALLQQLLIDMPAQFANLDLALQVQDFEQAWVVAHKIHGGFCFYGFNDFKQLAQALEQALLDHDVEQIARYFEVLRHKFAGLMRERSAIFERIAAQGY